MIISRAINIRCGNAILGHIWRAKRSLFIINAIAQVGIVIVESAHMIDNLCATIAIGHAATTANAAASATAIAIAAIVIMLAAIVTWWFVVCDVCWQTIILAIVVCSSAIQTFTFQAIIAVCCACILQIFQNRRSHIDFVMLLHIRSVC